MAKSKTKEDGKEKEVPDPNEPKVPFYDPTFFYIIGLEWVTFTLGFIFFCLNGSMPILFYLFLGDLITGFADPTVDIVQVTSKYAGFMAIIAAISAVVSFGSQFFSSLAYERIGSKLRDAYFTSLMTQEIGYFDRKKSGKLLTQLSEDILLIQEIFGTKVPTSGQFLCQGVFGIIMAFASSWRMSLLMLATAPIMGGSIIISAGLQQWFQKKMLDTSGIAVQNATEVIGSIRTVRSMAGEEKELNKFTRNLTSMNLIGYLQSVTQGISQGTVQLAIWCSVAAAFWYGGYLVSISVIQVGDMMKVFGMMLMSVLGFSMFLGVFQDLGKAKEAIRKIVTVVKRKPMIKFAGGTYPNEDLKGNIEFKNVNFAYPTRPDTKVMKDFNLNISPGEQVALVGPSGSGKSTTVALLEKFYEPDSGEIIIDGYKLSKLAPEYLHKQVGIVTQEPVLFAMSIRDNILYSVDKKNVTEDDIIQAAIKANAHDFIMELPKKYDTMIGERGVSVSGGQKQRIAIARAVLQNPNILLLDEATSALDSEAEHVVQDALNKLMEGRTTIIIAHRLTTIQDVDKIVVIEYGEIKEIGSHEELLKIKNGVYHKLASRQMMYNNKIEEQDKGLVDVKEQEISPEVEVSN
eukprot:gene9016-1115_t